MADKKERMQVSWRLDYLSDNERKKINDWLEGQSNIQKSITNVVLHAIDRFGNQDIMDHDIQRVLFTEAAPLEAKQPVKENKPAEPPQSEINKNEEDDFFDNINEDNL